MKMIGVGDNVADCYLDEKLFYPGGNAVNVAVGCARAGCEVAYLGVFGSDEEAEHIKYALQKENIAFPRCRSVQAPSGHPGVKLTAEGDRVFVGGPQNTAQHIVRLRLTKEDLAYISQFDICHTSCYSSIEPELRNLQACCEVSFDFSSGNTDESYLNSVCKYIKYAFFSGSDMSDPDLEKLLQKVHSYGVEIVGITQGAKGALFSWKQNGEAKQYRQGIIPVNVVDTMGAGDSFIAGFLSRFVPTQKMEEALLFAAQCAAKSCQENGGFGYGKNFPLGCDFPEWHISK